jgi:hypothetical protein
MSKGHGATQRAVLDYLASQPRQHRQRVYRNDQGEEYEVQMGGEMVTRMWPRWVPLREVAEAIFGGPPARAQVESVRRAVKRLAAQNLAEITERDFRVELTRPSYPGEAVRRWLLCVRSPLTEAEDAAMEPLRQQAARATATLRGLSAMR